MIVVRCSVCDRPNELSAEGVSTPPRCRACGAPLALPLTASEQSTISSAEPTPESQLRQLWSVKGPAPTVTKAWRPPVNPSPELDATQAVSVAEVQALLASDAVQPSNAQPAQQPPVSGAVPPSALVYGPAARSTPKDTPAANKPPASPQQAVRQPSPKPDPPIIVEPEAGKPKRGKSAASRPPTKSAPRRRTKSTAAGAAKPLARNLPPREPVRKLDNPPDLFDTLTDDAAEAGEEGTRDSAPRVVGRGNRRGKKKAAGLKGVIAYILATRRRVFWCGFGGVYLLLFLMSAVEPRGIGTLFIALPIMVGMVLGPMALALLFLQRVLDGFVRDPGGRPFSKGASVLAVTAVTGCAWTGLQTAAVVVLGLCLLGLVFQSTETGERYARKEFRYSRLGVLALQVAVAMVISQALAGFALISLGAKVPLTGDVLSGTPTP